MVSTYYELTKYFRLKGDILMVFFEIKESNWRNIVEVSVWIAAYENCSIFRTALQKWTRKDLLKLLFQPWSEFFTTPENICECPPTNKCSQTMGGGGGAGVIYPRLQTLIEKVQKRMAIWMKLEFQTNQEQENCNQIDAVKIKLFHLGKKRCLL